MQLVTAFKTLLCGGLLFGHLIISPMPALVAEVETPALPMVVADADAKAQSEATGEAAEDAPKPPPAYFVRNDRSTM